MHERKCIMSQVTVLNSGGGGRFEQRGGGCKSFNSLLVFLEYLNGPLELSRELRCFPRAIKARRNNAKIFKIVRYRVTSPEVKVSGWFIGENMINLVIIESQGENQLFNVDAFLFEDSEGTTACSNMFKIRSAFNRKSKWRSWNWKYLYLKLQK